MTWSAEHLCKACSCYCVTFSTSHMSFQSLWYLLLYCQAWPEYDRSEFPVLFLSIHFQVRIVLWGGRKGEAGGSCFLFIHTPTFFGVDKYWRLKKWITAINGRSELVQRKLFFQQTTLHIFHGRNMVGALLFSKWLLCIQDFQSTRPLKNVDFSGSQIRCNVCTSLLLWNTFKLLWLQNTSCNQIKMNRKSQRSAAFCE